FLLVPDQVGVMHFQQTCRRKHRTPVIDEAPMLTVVVSQVGQVQGKTVESGKRLKITRQTRIDGIAAHVNDARVGEYGVDGAEIVRVECRLVDYAPRIRKRTLQGAQIALGELAP